MRFLNIFLSVFIWKEYFLSFPIRLVEMPFLFNTKYKLPVVKFSTSHCCYYSGIIYGDREIFKVNTSTHNITSSTAVTKLVYHDFWRGPGHKTHIKAMKSYSKRLFELFLDQIFIIIILTEIIATRVVFSFSLQQ